MTTFLLPTIRYKPPQVPLLLRADLFPTRHVPMPEYKPMTPWQKVMSRFNMPVRELARLMHRDQSAICRAINSPHGVISGNHQRILIKIAKARGISLRAEDLVPDEVKEL